MDLGWASVGPRVGPGEPQLGRAPGGPLVGWAQKRINSKNFYIILYVIPIGYVDQYYIVLIVFLYGLVTPSPVYGGLGLPQASFLKNDMLVLKSYVYKTNMSF